MSTTQCLKTEAEVFSQLLNETQEHALAGMTELWNVMNEYGHLACDGMELFSQYIWNTLPEFYEPALLDVNLFNMDDEDFFFVAEEPVLRRRRSMLYIGSRWSIWITSNTELCSGMTMAQEVCLIILYQ